jgi:TPP-dependent pyruvate/acetoin dehydrogenase alpha subunit
MGDQSSRRLLFYRSKEQVEAWRKVPVADKLARLQAQMEFFHKTMTEKARQVRDRLKEGKEEKVEGGKGKG